MNHTIISLGRIIVIKSDRQINDDHVINIFINSIGASDSRRKGNLNRLMMMQCVIYRIFIFMMGNLHMIGIY